MAAEKRRYQELVEKMLQLIDGGEFPVGGRLPPERELAERFKVSRPTIREAVIALEVMGRVQVKSGSGVYVLAPRKRQDIPDEDISAFELTEARALFEGEAAALAAKMITKEELEALEQTLVDMAEEDNREISNAADKRFHRIISQATRNAMVSSVIDRLWFVRDNTPQVHSAYEAICDVDMKARVEEHRRILDALKQGDDVAARKEMHNHFARIISKLIAVMEEHQVREVRQRALESRQRFSLAHLVS